jgi:hypothetical protein
MLFFLANFSINNVFQLGRGGGRSGKRGRFQESTTKTTQNHAAATAQHVFLPILGQEEVMKPE